MKWLRKSPDWQLKDLFAHVSSATSNTPQHANESDLQVDDENKEPSSSASVEPRPWRERYRWLGVMMMAAFAGFAPAPPPPKPPRELSEYAQLAEDPDKLKLDPELHFLQKALNEDESSLNA